ncbi:MAG: molybdopterin dehydrogenase [Planctomycetota bacterium]|nr:MAG: molybdopterin dehydrogenase [Planctomycetota bacterium]
MNNFAYAQPRRLESLLALLSPTPGETEVLAGGTDLVGLLRERVLTPERVVNVCDVEELQGVHEVPEGGALALGAAMRLDELHEHSLLESYTALHQAICGLRSLQYQAQSTLGGELCRRPRCWYFRAGHGLLADGGRLIREGDNRYHAIFDNAGPAKFVSASRLAPALIALDARAVLVGPEPDYLSVIPLEELYQTPIDESQRETILQPNQVLAQILLPQADASAAVASAAYEVRHGEGPDDPLAAAAASLRIESGVVRQAKLVLGQVAPTPRVADTASRLLVGHAVDQLRAEAAGRAAVADATPLSRNEYKVQLAEVAATRAILKAAGLATGGFDE